MWNGSSGLRVAFSSSRYSIGASFRLEISSGVRLEMSSSESGSEGSEPKKSEFFRPIFVASSGGAITVDILLLLVLLLVLTLILTFLVVTLSGAKAFVKERMRDICTSAVTSIIICFLEKIILVIY